MEVKFYAVFDAADDGGCVFITPLFQDGVTPGALRVLLVDTIKDDLACGQEEAQESADAVETAYIVDGLTWEKINRAVRAVFVGDSESGIEALTEAQVELAKSFALRTVPL